MGMTSAPTALGYKVRGATDPADPVLLYSFAGLKRIEDGTGTVHLETDIYGIPRFVLTPPVYSAGYEDMFAKLKVLEIFNAQPFVNPPRGLSTEPAWKEKPGYLTHIDNEPRPPNAPLLEPGVLKEFVYTVGLSQQQV